VFFRVLLVSFVLFRPGIARAPVFKLLLYKEECKGVKRL